MCAGDRRLHAAAAARAEAAAAIRVTFEIDLFEVERIRVEAAGDPVEFVHGPAARGTGRIEERHVLRCPLVPIVARQHPARQHDVRRQVCQRLRRPIRARLINIAYIRRRRWRTWRRQCLSGGRGYGLHCSRNNPAGRHGSRLPELRRPKQMDVARRVGVVGSDNAIVRDALLHRRGNGLIERIVVVMIVRGGRRIVDVHRLGGACDPEDTRQAATRPGANRASSKSLSDTGKHDAVSLHAGVKDPRLVPLFGTPPPHALAQSTQSANFASRAFTVLHRYHRCGFASTP